MDITFFVFAGFCVGFYQVQKAIVKIKHKKLKYMLHKSQERVYNIIK
jgi:hypothetical protein